MPCHDAHMAHCCMCFFTNVKSSLCLTWGLHRHTLQLFLAPLFVNMPQRQAFFSKRTEQVGI